MSHNIDKLLEGARSLDQKQIVYKKLRVYLGLLIDDATPTDMLPYGVPKDVAQEVYDELSVREAECDDEKRLLLQPKKPPRKSPAKQKKSTPKAKKSTPKKDTKSGSAKGREKASATG